MEVHLAKKNELAALSKVMPSSAEIEKILDELRMSADIAAAITGAAIIEARLEQLIRTKLRSKRGDLGQQLFENRGPLSDFNSKILVAEAFGVVNTPIAGELQMVRAVRNTFAHAKHTFTFDHAAVEKKTRSSPMLAAIDALPPVPGYDRGLPNTKGAYLLVIRILLILFDGFENSSASPNEVIAEALDKDGGKAVT